ncbi:hypothetical protein [Mucilaginibacter myungsuensis]|uniref:Uncharacterized protein n=1 Tax=Mucilaginibacter myungsuensis TaxID=649104 RepID=A0A929KV37_9SPHI|nr:hypothetical protein [Mucilaginibacter myungsuensis]MBE9662139.1 hypothetical protein [Mucilaginibacter myungsuensis]MDN3599427.1 hypothetical protein [Mucilaginibacter myungsuensis]
MREIADQFFHIFVMVVILGFGLLGFLATGGSFDSWRSREGEKRRVNTVKRRIIRLGKFKPVYPQVPFRNNTPAY